jgi:hypothetical protein
MGIPNIQQQLYLKKALNENTDGMFDHPEVQHEETITEGLRNKMKSVLASISEASPAMDRANKILRGNERGKISPAEMKWLKKQKASLAKIKPKYAPGQDPVVNSRKES